MLGSGGEGLSVEEEDEEELIELKENVGQECLTLRGSFASLWNLSIMGFEESMRARGDRQKVELLA